MAQEKKASRLTRRTVIQSATFVPLAALTTAAQNIKSVFTPEQRRTLDAFLDRLCPKDELGPGAVEIGAADYIDRQLGEYLAPEKAAFLSGLAAVDAYAHSSAGAALADLSPEKRDEVLTGIDSGKAPPATRAFFNRARRLMLEGMFGDPHYGGNKNYAGWDLIRYPGPRLAVGPEEQKMNVAIKPYHRSAWGDDHGH
jgi:gluconate 2-dehydrogenase gamma chain